MATYFWVGGNGTWNATATANWSLSSGGSGSQGVPTSTDNVVFDNSSGFTTSNTVTVTASSATCQDFTCSVSTATPAFSGTLSSITGSFTSVGSTASLATLNIIFTSTVAGKTIATPSGAALGNITLNGSSLTLASTLSCTSITITSGQFAAGYAIATSSITSTGSNFRTIGLGAVTHTLYGNPSLTLSGTNLTFAANTSTLNLTNATSTTFNGGGYTFYNVVSTCPTTYLNGANTFNNLTLCTPVINVATYTLLGANQTVNGTLTSTFGTVDGQTRAIIAAQGTSTIYTITAAATSLFDVDFRRITAAGAASPFTGTRLGNQGGNSNITFPAAKTVYLVGTTGVNIYSAAWATSSNGATSGANFPLAQDTAVIDNFSANSGQTITNSTVTFIGNLTFSTRSNPVTIGSDLKLYGNFTGSSATTIGGNSYLFLYGIGSFTFNQNGATISTTGGIVLETSSGTYQLISNVSLTGVNSTFTFNYGTLDINNFVLTCPIFNSNLSAARTLAFGSTGKIVLTGSSITILNLIANFLTTTGNKVVECNYSGSVGTRTITNSTTEASSLTIKITAGSDTVVVNVGYNLDFTGFTGTLSNGTFGSYAYNNLVTNSTMTYSGSAAITMYGTSGTSTITTGGATYTVPVTFGGVAGTATYQLIGNLTTTSTLTLTTNTFDSNGYNVTAASFSSNNANTRSLIMGASTWTITGAGGWIVAGGTFTLNAGTSTINMSSASTKPFTGGGQTYYNLVQTGLGTLTVSGNNAFNNFSNTVQPTTILFTSGITTTFTNFSLSGTAGNLVSLTPTNASISYTLAKSSGTVSANYLSISRSTALGGAAWYAGANSTDGGNNTGWVFTPPPVIVSVFGVQGSAVVNSVTVGTGTNYGVTGVTGTTALGTVTYPNASFNITGVQASGAVGTVFVETAVNVTKVTGTTALGTVSLVSNNFIPVTGVQGITALGTVSLSTQQIIAETGLVGTTALGSVTINQGAGVSPTGVQATTAVGSTTVSLLTPVPVIGVAGAAVLGNETSFGDAIVTLIKVTGTTALGTTTQTGTAAISPTGVTGTSYLGAITLIVNGGTTFTPNGVQGTTALGTVVTPNIYLNLSGVQGTTALGSVTLNQGAGVNAVGLQGTTALGTISVTLLTTALVTGVQGTTALGSVTINQGVGVYPTGVQAPARLGNIQLVTNNFIPVNGVEGVALLSTGETVPVTGVFGVSRLNYVTVLLWSVVDTYELNDWQDIPHQSG